MERIPNAEQRQVIEAVDHNLIVYASAGTGKTFTVAKRVENILRNGLASAEEILLLTFTTKACEEMRADIRQYVGEGAGSLAIHTIHSFCYRLLREESKARGDRYLDVTVVDEQDGEELLKSILATQYALWKGEESEESYYPFSIFEKKGKVQSFVSALKHVREAQGFYSEDVEADYQKTYDHLRIHTPDLYQKLTGYSVKGGTHVCDHEFQIAMNRFAGKWVYAYDDYLKKSNRVDYDDLILLASRYLREKETLEKWSTKYRYIVVDEMQDTSLLEYSILKRIFGKNNVMMCGDFFQSIYEWRGSRPDEVLGDFMQNFSAKVYTFSENYRSTKRLTQATFGYLKETYPSLLGKYCPQDITINASEEGEKILLMGFDNRREEAHRIYRYLQKCIREGENSLCVIARSNFYLASLLRYFEEFNLEEGERLSFFTAEEDLQFYRKPIVKDVLAMLKLLFYPTDRVSMERISERFVRQVGAVTLEKIRLENRVGVSIVSFLNDGVHTHLDPYHVLVDGFLKGEIIVYDTETTGLELRKGEKVQLSAIRLGKDGNIVDVFDQMILPSVSIGEDAYKTHGFDLEYIRSHGGVSAKEALEKFSAFVKGGTLVGHNSMRFDSPLIQRQLKDNGLPPLEIKGEYDTLTIAKEFHSNLPDFKLSTLCFKYDIVNESAHNAYGDIVATGKVLYRFLTEDILPTTLERQRICEKYRDKFTQLYSFFKELKGKVRAEDGGTVLRWMVEKMHLHAKCHSDGDRRALEWLLQSFENIPKEETESALLAFVTNAELSSTGMGNMREKGIPLLTVHQAKGCEFDVVLLAGADDKNFPSIRAQQEGQVEGEKKLFYVALSRAKKKLILTRALYQGQERLYPSPFVKNIPEDCLWRNERWDCFDE